MAPSIRVALFCGNYNYTRDGANLALNRLVGFLESHGCVVRVYSPATAHPAFAPAGTLVAAPSIPIPFRGEYRLALGLTASLRADFLAFAPHVVHVATPDRLGWQAAVLARALGTPVVASVHTRFETYLGYYGLGWTRPVVEAYLDAFYRHCDIVLAPNAGMAAELAARHLGARIGVWGRGVDQALFDPARRDEAWRRAQGFSPDDVVILFFGRLVREKGLAAFARVVRRAAARDPHLRVLVIGDGPARCGFARRLPGARFLGTLTGRDLGRAVASADLLFNPSVTEAFGNVTLEAMAAGLPVLCAEAPAHRALVGPDCGLLRAIEDEGGLVDGLLMLAADREGRRIMGDAARRRSLDHQWPAALAAVIDAYRRALDEGAGDDPMPWSLPPEAEIGRAAGR